MNKKKSNGGKWLIFIIILIIFIRLVIGCESDNNNSNHEYSDKVFSVIASSENKLLYNTLKDYAKKNKIDIDIVFMDTLDVVETLNSGAKYDAVLISNSIWLSKIKASLDTSSLKSTSVTPIIFGIKKSKAEQLGFVNKKVYTKDILNSIKNKELTFSIANPITTNSGASAYLEILSNLAGNPEVLKESHLKDSKLKSEMKSFFNGIKRTSGDEDFLEQSFVNGDYDAAFTYESSIININKQLEKEGKETLYAIYPVDGVAISDSPFVYIDNKNDNKRKLFNDIQEYLLSSEGQDILLKNGRRTWYGGTNANAPTEIFNPSWGINTKDYITPIRYPSMDVITKALELYQTEFRKPVHVVFCLDYSGSMYGDGIYELIDAMEYVLTSTDLTVSFNSKDKIDIVPFGTKVLDVWSTTDGYSKEDLLNKIKEQDLSETTALYPAAIKGLEILSKEDSNEYVSSIILMTDGLANVGTYRELERKYTSLNREIPIYSITFGDADESELLEISSLTNGKVFDGKTNLTLAFKKVRGYN